MELKSAKLPLAVLISGRGSNLQSLIDACAASDFPAEIKIVISNVPDAYGLKRAEAAEIPAVTVNHKNHSSREDFEDALMAVIKPHDVRAVCLAGFMRVLTPHFINQWLGRLINIHPSLLPDYKGLNTHARVLADKKSESGCTVHYVVPDVDSGEIIVQKRVPVEPGDTEETLAARVLNAEHQAYPEAVRILARKLGY